MNREIKFRAWDGNKMVVPCSIEFESSAYGLGQLSEKYTQLMQYTGLKDKNGVEIYEGDLATDAHNEHYEVVFSDASFAVVHEGNVIEPLNDVASEIEIIGNIYENPDLLSLDKLTDNNEKEEEE